jgi:hypothetical protein
MRYVERSLTTADVSRRRPLSRFEATDALAPLVLRSASEVT